MRTIPSDFLQNAPGMRTVEAAARWGVSENTARKWFRESGIRPVHAKRPGRPAGHWETRDSPEHIQTCLNCKRTRCDGSCEKVR